MKIIKRIFFTLLVIQVIFLGLKLASIFNLHWMVVFIPVWMIVLPIVIAIFMFSIASVNGVKDIVEMIADRFRNRKS
jgi:hypothetical protein